MHARQLQPAVRRRIGPYTLVDHLGRGGMADVFLARRRGRGGPPQRLFAVKVVLDALDDDPRLRSALAAEAALGARLDHPGVVRVEELGWEGERPYLAMEYVEGIDLRQLLRGATKRKLGLPIALSLSIIVEVLRALEHVHSARDVDGEPLHIVHRDVSPANVLLGFDGAVKLCDFGIALHDGADGDDRIEGKAGYMSPEQALGMDLDRRADLFAVGVLMWELLSGRRMYKSDGDAALIEKAARGDVPPLVCRGLPHEEVLHRIVFRALQRDRDDRYRSATAMAEALETYCANHGLRFNRRARSRWLRENFAADVLPRRLSRVQQPSLVDATPAPPAVSPTPPEVDDADVSDGARPSHVRAKQIVSEPAGIPWRAGLRGFFVMTLLLWTLVALGVI